jgi:hypothetical protein
MQTHVRLSVGLPHLRTPDAIFGSSLAGWLASLFRYEATLTCVQAGHGIIIDR